jgi:hypothetical protein
MLPLGFKYRCVGRWGWKQSFVAVAYLLIIISIQEADEDLSCPLLVRWPKCPSRWGSPHPSIVCLIYLDS